MEISNNFMKIIYFAIIPILVFLTAFLGSKITDQGMTWYKTISLPSWTPPGFVIGIVWTIIFILLTLAMIVSFLKIESKKTIILLSSLFILNLFLNVLWSYLFFGIHNIGGAFFEAIILDLSVMVIALVVYPFSKLASLLLLPYIVWVAFASYLTHSVWFLNR